MGPWSRRRAPHLFAWALALSAVALGVGEGWPAADSAERTLPSTPPAPAAPPAASAPGVPAPPAAVRELGAALEQARQRLEARDAAGVLAHVSDAYRSGGFTKPVVRDQLLALFSLYDTLRARIRIDEVRLVGDTAWVYSTGELTGRLPIVRTWTTFLTWEREPEVARREAGAWRLYGFQQ